MSMKIILFCIVLLSIEHSTVGLTCYQCSSGTDGCGPSFDADGNGVVKITRSSGSPSCSKVVSASNGNVINRANSASCTAETVAAGDGTDGTITYCCDTDLCNRSAINSASFLSLMAISTLILFKFILN